MKYSGLVSFEFYVERYINKISSEPKPLDQVHPEDEYLYDYEEVTLHVRGSSYYASGKVSGSPETSYPDEGDIEIISVTGPGEKDWENNLTADERKKVLRLIDENVQEAGADVNEDDEPFEFTD